MTSEIEFNNVELEEFDRQFYHIQNLKKIDFFAPSYNYKVNFQFNRMQIFISDGFAIAY